MMKHLSTRMTWALSLGAVLMVLLLVSARKAGSEVGAQPQWVTPGSSPGFYAARDTRNLDPSFYHLTGGHQSFYWDQLEPAEGVYRFDEVVEPFIEAERAKGKRAAFGIITFNGRANQHNPTDPAYHVPSWVDQAGHRPIVCTDDFKIPRYWDETYKAKYRNFVHALAERYKRDPRVEFIQIGVGRFGETQPCDDDPKNFVNDDPCVAAAMAADGLPEGAWAGIVNEITAMYVESFCFEPGCVKLLLPNAPTFARETERRDFTDYAITNTVGLFLAELYVIPQWVDLRTKPGWNGVGKLDRILDQVEAEPNDQRWVSVAFEGYDNMVGGSEEWHLTPNPNQFFWAIGAALHHRADYITLERNLLYCNWCDGWPPYTDILAVMGWASQYLGRHVNETPSVWVILRETGYCYDPGCAVDIYPQKGNYSFWLTQDDSLPGGRTVPTTYLPRNETVLAGHWSTYGISCTNSMLEVGQDFLRGAGDSGLREGWVCRRTDQASGNRYMGFKIDDRYRNAHPVGEATVTVTYFDRGNDSWRLEYDSESGIGIRTVSKGNSNTWRQAVFDLTDARFRNGVSGADFRIDCLDDGDEYIHMVDVKLSESGPTFTPSNTPFGTCTPTPTLTSSPTSTASATPTASETPTGTFTNTPQVTETPSATATPSETPDPAETPTGTCTATKTPTPTESPTPTPTVPNRLLLPLVQASFNPPPR